MDFFAAGGFQQVFSDLHGQQIDVIGPMDVNVDFDNFTETTITATETVNNAENYIYCDVNFSLNENCEFEFFEQQQNTFHNHKDNRDMPDLNDNEFEMQTQTTSCSLNYCDLNNNDDLIQFCKSTICEETAGAAKQHVTTTDEQALKVNCTQHETANHELEQQCYDWNLHLLTSLNTKIISNKDILENLFQTTEVEEWEEKFLENFIEIPELVEILPEKTPFCNDMCDNFLQESSQNLQLQQLEKQQQQQQLQQLQVQQQVQQQQQQQKRQKFKTKTKAKGIENMKCDTNSADIECSTLKVVGVGVGGAVSTIGGYTCTFGSCQKIYAKPAHLKAHLRRHLGEKPYICNWPDCTWKFSRSDELARHRRSHSGIKPYKCDYCSKCFARSDHLTKHRKVHERRMLAASKAGKLVDGILPNSVLTVRPGRKRKNQLC